MEESEITAQKIHNAARRVRTKLAFITTFALTSLSPKASAENVHRDDTQKWKITAVDNNISPDISDDTVRYDAIPGQIGREPSASDTHSVEQTNIVLPDGRIVINNPQTLKSDFGIDINDINIQIPDNLLGCNELNKINPSSMSKKIDYHANHTKGHKNKCTGDVKRMFEKLYYKSIKDKDAWGNIVWSDQFYAFVKEGKLRGFVAFVPNQEVITNDVNFTATVCWFDKKPKKNKHTGVHVGNRSKLNEEGKMNAWPNGGYCVNPSRYGGVGLVMPNEEIVCVVPKDYVLIFDKNTNEGCYQKMTDDLQKQINDAERAAIIAKIKPTDENTTQDLLAVKSKAPQNPDGPKISSSQPKPQSNEVGKINPMPNVAVQQRRDSYRNG